MLAKNAKYLTFKIPVNIVVYQIFIVINKQSYVIPKGNNIVGDD